MCWDMIGSKKALSNVTFLAQSQWQRPTHIGGTHSTMDKILASHPAAPGSIPAVPKNFSDVAVVNWQCRFLDQWTAEA